MNYDIMDFNIWRKVNEKFNISYGLFSVIIFALIILSGLVIGLIIMFAQKSQIMSESFENAMDMLINSPPAEAICNCLCNCTN